MMKIRYSKERLRVNLRMGIFFIISGLMLVLLSLITGELKGISLSSIGIGLVGAGISMLVLYFFENKRQYLSLKNGELIKNTLFPKKIKLTEIKSIREIAGDIKLSMEKSEFTINTQIIDPTSLVELKNELKK